MKDITKETLEKAISERKYIIECMGDFDPLSYEDFHYREKLKKEIADIQSDLLNKEE